MRTFSLKVKDALVVDSSAGNLLKWKVVENGKTLFIKTSTFSNINFKNEWMYESYSEVIVCRLLRELGIDNVVKYYLCKINLDNGLSTIGCYSYSFLKQNEKYVSLAHLHKIAKLRNYMFEGYNGYIQCIQDVANALGIEYKDELDKIITVDWITLNEDRHTGNFGFIYNYRDKRFSIAPIFDNGNSLFSLKHVEGLNYSEQLDQYAKSKPFYYLHELQLKMIGKPYKINKNIIEIYAYIDKLVNYGLPKERAQFIKELISTRLSKLT